MQIWQGDNVEMKCSSIHENLPRGTFSVCIEWLWIPIRPNVLISLLRYPKIIVQYTKINHHVRCDNQFISPYISKTENLNEIIMLLFIQQIWPTPFLLFYTFLGCIFIWSELPFSLIFYFTLCIFGCDAWWLYLCWD